MTDLIHVKNCVTWNNCQIGWTREYNWIRFPDHHLIHLMTKLTKCHVRPATTQISLGIRPVWPESSLCAQWVAKDRKRRLIRLGNWPGWSESSLCTHSIVLVLSWSGSFSVFLNLNTIDVIATCPCTCAVYIAFNKKFYYLRCFLVNWKKKLFNDLQCLLFICNLYRYFQICKGFYSSYFHSSLIICST